MANATGFEGANRTIAVPSRLIDERADSIDDILFAGVHRKRFEGSFTHFDFAQLSLRARWTRCMAQRRGGQNAGMGPRKCRPEISKPDENDRRIGNCSNSFAIRMRQFVCDQLYMFAN